MNVIGAGWLKHGLRLNFTSKFRKAIFAFLLFSLTLPVFAETKKYQCRWCGEQSSYPSSTSKCPVNGNKHILEIMDLPGNSVCWQCENCGVQCNENGYPQKAGCKKTGHFHVWKRLYPAKSLDDFQCNKCGANPKNGGHVTKGGSVPSPSKCRQNNGYNHVWVRNR